jgi:hypothetical protein
VTEAKRRQKLFAWKQNTKKPGRPYTDREEMALFVWVVLQCAAHYGFVLIFSLFACLLRLWGLAAGLTKVPGVHPLSTTKWI